MVDVFLFPAKYRNEAELIVVLEALKNGSPVIAFDRGTIYSTISPRCGLVAPKDSDFVSLAIDQLGTWWRVPETYAQASVSARRQFLQIRDGSTEQFSSLLAMFRDSAGSSGHPC